MKKGLDVELPNVPNYIKVGSEFVDIASFTNDELLTLGSDWTAKLVAKATQRRQPKH